MFVEYVNTLNEDFNPSDIIRSKGLKIQNEIYRKQGVEYIFYTVDDCIKARFLLKEYKTSIADNKLFVWFE